MFTTKAFFAATALACVLLFTTSVTPVSASTCDIGCAPGYFFFQLYCLVCEVLEGVLVSRKPDHARSLLCRHILQRGWRKRQVRMHKVSRRILFPSRCHRLHTLPSTLHDVYLRSVSLHQVPRWICFQRCSYRLHPMSTRHLHLQLIQRLSPLLWRLQLQESYQR